MRIIVKNTALCRPTHSFAFSNSKSPQRMEQIRWQTPLSQYPNLEPRLKQHLPTSTLINQDPETKIKFLVEQGGFSNCADMGICIKLGTQDETKENAGSLQYLKSIVHMKPTLEQLVNNYEFLQQTGSSFDFNYDITTSYAKCSFFQEDKDMMVDLLLDLAFQQKQMYEDNYQTMADLTNIVQLSRRAAFGDKGVGMPMGGLGNILTNKAFLQFQQKIVPENTIISMSNIQNPDETIAEILSKIKKNYSKYLNRKKPQQAQSTYKGGLSRFVSDNQFFQFAIAFPGVPFKSPHMELFNILRVLLGTASSFSSGGPGKGMHSRCTKYLLNRVPCVQKASFINEHYEQMGLFGLTVGGPHQNPLDVIKCTLNQFRRLAYAIPEDELNRCKNILISSLSVNTERQADRLEQLTKHIFYYDRVRLHEYEGKIRAVTAAEIQQVILQMFKNKPTFVYSGNQKSLSKLPGEADLENQWKKLFAK